MQKEVDDLCTIAINAAMWKELAHIIIKKYNIDPEPHIKEVQEIVVNGMGKNSRISALTQDAWLDFLSEVKNER